MFGSITKPSHFEHEHHCGASLAIAPVFEDRVNEKLSSILYRYVQWIGPCWIIEELTYVGFNMGCNKLPINQILYRIDTIKFVHNLIWSSIGPVGAV